MKTLPIDELATAKMLVRVPNWIGDAVLCLPALRALRRALPKAELVVVARPWVADIFRGEELRCRTVAYDSLGRHKGLSGRLRMASILRPEGFAAAILFQNAFDAALLALLARIPIRAGYSRHGRRPLLTHPVPVPRRGEIPRHQAHHYLELLRRLGLIEAFSEVRQIPLHGSGHTAARNQLEKLLEKQWPLAWREKLLVGIGAGATFGTAKRWPPERFAQLARRLSEESGAACVFFGSEHEKPLAESLVAQAGNSAASLAGETSLADFVRVVEGCDLYITNDTGTMHVAAALGVPTLAIFGPTDEQATRPLGARAQVAAGKAFCRPCLLRHCPIDHRCMTSVSVEDVFRAAQSILSQTLKERSAWQASPD
jgi:heptosyltransferase-2